MWNEESVSMWNEESLVVWNRKFDSINLCILVNEEPPTMRMFLLE